MKNSVLWLFTLALVAGGAFYYGRYGLGLQELPAQALEPQIVVREPEAPQVRYPLHPASAQRPANSGSAAPAPEPLPPLGESDGAALKTLSGLLGPQALTLFKPDNLVRRLTVSLDNLPREQVPAKFLPIDPLTGSFQVRGEGEHVYLAESNYPRYGAHVDLLGAVDAEAAVTAYARYYPLFQAAFAELGYPEDYFNDRLVEVIDDLLATPKLQGPIELVRPSVMYKFADPQLEELSAGQKMLIRMGPANAARVQQKLRQIRAALMARVAPAD
jgi:hypothetical protein